MTFEEIYNTYRQKIFRLCMGYINDVERAKDITQDTFISVWQNLPGFRNESSLGTWVFRIAANHCLRQIERENRISRAPMPADIPEITDASQPETERRKEFLYKCISELPETDRLIISLELEDIKQSEIAVILGLSEANVRVKIHRIKEKFTLKFNGYEE